MNVGTQQQQHQSHQPKAPPPSAFPLPPPPPLPSSTTMALSSSGRSSPHNVVAQQQQQSLQPGGGTANIAATQHQGQSYSSSATPLYSTSASTTTSGLYPSARGSYSSSQYPSPYLLPPTPALGSSSLLTGGGDGTLKARNVTTSSSGTGRISPVQIIAGSRKAQSAKMTTTTNAPPPSASNNNKSIALLLLPPLLYLFLCEMSSSLPLLAFLCLGLIVYSFDLANVGSGDIMQQQSKRGYYTLAVLWISWLVLSLVVGYDAIFLGEEEGGSVPETIIGDNMLSEEKGGGDNNLNLDAASNNYSTASSSSIFGLALLLTKLSMSILLLFNFTAWTTLQFNWLLLQMPVLAMSLERMVHSTLPPVSAATVAYGLFSESLGGLNMSTWGMDGTAILVPHVFAFHLALGILILGSAPSMVKKGNANNDYGYDDDANDKMRGKKPSVQSTATNNDCAIHPREGRKLSYLLVFLPPLIHLIAFRQRLLLAFYSWDDMHDLLLISTVPYTLHYLLASNGILDEKWRRSLPGLLNAGTSPADSRTLRGATVPMAVSLIAAMSFQRRYLVPLCSRLSYIINGHDGVVSPVFAAAFLTLGTIFGYATLWFFGRKDATGTNYLLGEYHEDCFQLLLAASSICYGLSCGPKWTFLPVPMLFAESLALWVITKQLRYAFLTAFVSFTVGSILVAYRLTFLSEVVEILPWGKTIVLKKFAEVALYSTLWLMLLVGLVVRAPGGYGTEIMRKYDVTGICWTCYGIILVVMEFALLKEPMPLYSRDNFEVGRVAVYSSGIAYLTGFLTIVITWHMKAQRLIKEVSTGLSTSIVIGKMLTVIIESSSAVTSYNSLGMLFLRWATASLLLLTICAPYYLLKPIHVKMSHSKKRRDPSAKPTSAMQHGLPNNASLTVILYCAVILPFAIVSSVRLVLEPLVGLLTGHNSSGASYYASSPKLSEIIGYSASLWGISVLTMINHFLPDGGAEVWRRISALTFIMGLFISFSAPAFPGVASSPSWDAGNVLFQSVSSSLDVAENDVATGGWGLISAFLAILLAMSGPLELREISDTSGRRDTRQLLRLMIFGMLFGCGLSWFITMQSMSKDIFIPIFVTTFSCMAMSTLGTVAAVMGFFLEASEFIEVEQIANIWAGIAFPVFFVISSVSLSAHAHPFGIGGWASTYLSVCGLLAGAFCLMVRLRDDKTSTTRGYGNMSCFISWLCAIIVVYGRYGIAGVGVVGTTAVAGIPTSVLGTVLCSPILLLLEGEGSSGGSSTGRKKYQVSSSSASTKTKKKGLVLSTLGRSNWFAPLLAGTVVVFLASSFYAIFLRGCGVSKFGFLFGTGDVVKSQEDVFSSHRTTGVGALDDVATMARKSVVHTRTMVAAAKLSGSGIWTSNNMMGPLMHLLGLVATIPSLQYLIRHSCYGSAPSTIQVRLSSPLNLVAMFVGRGIPSLVAAAAIGLVGGMMQLSFLSSSG